MNADRSEQTKSSRRYDPRTLKLVWGRAAGRCAMPNCRIELFVTEPGYSPVWNIGEMGHIVASSNDGPRSDSGLSLVARDVYSNLILLCRNCHGKIDGLKDLFPVDRLLEIKANHEEWVRTALPERGSTRVWWSVLWLQGDFPFDASTIVTALAPDQENYEVQIAVSPSNLPWGSIKEKLFKEVGALLRNVHSISARVAVFPLAPVSACLYTGYLLTNRVNVRAFQYHREDASWEWPRTVRPGSSPKCLETVEAVSQCPDIFFLFGLTAPIDASSARAKVEGEQAVYECSVPDPSTAWLRSKPQLDDLARKSREMFEQASIKYPHSRRWHIIYAGPAPGAIVVGQQLNPTMVPDIQCYEFQRPDHIASITIRPFDSSLTRWTSATPNLTGRISGAN
jgi:hypothetical protein